MLQNTSMNMRDVMDLSIPQVEYLLEGFKKNNEDKDDKTYTDGQAIQRLIETKQIS